MFGSLSRALHSLIGIILGILLLPIPFLPTAFFPLGVTLAVIIWPSACVAFCMLAITCFLWIPALLFCFIIYSLIAFIFEVIASFYGAFCDLVRQPPQHPQPFQDVPALPSGIPASRSDSVAGGSSLPPTPGADAAADIPGWLERRLSNLTQKNFDDDDDEDDDIGLVMPGSNRGIRNYPPRRSSSIAATSSSSVNVSAPAHSTTSVNSILTNSSTRSAAAPSTPATPATPTRHRTKSISFEDGSRPGLSVSHSTTSMVIGSPRVSSQQGASSSTTSLGSTTGSVEDAIGALRVGQLMQEASEEDEIRHH